MKSFLHSTLKLFVATTLASTVMATSLLADTKEKFQVAWTIYVGWMPWDYAQQTGIIDKWAKKYGIQIEMVQVNDYVESINQYTAGKFDGCVMTNMDALTIPAAGGVDSTALIVGDFSNGNDGIILKNKKKLSDIKGQSVNLVELSVSHYLLARGLESVGLKEKDIKVINTSDADIVAAFSSKDVTSLVTWNPQLSEIAGMKNASLVFDSSKIPGEIIDMLVMNTKTIEENPKLAKALTGAWYEVMALMKKGDESALKAMATASGTDLAGFNAQLKTTMLFHDASEAVKFTTSDALPKTMQKVSQFSFDHGILGDSAKNAAYVGMQFPNGKTYGNQSNVKLRFIDTYMKMASDGTL
ncbi:putative urea ABC transporter substrate-binding protein [Sulfurospirillum multivorans]|uniref:Urea carboxylase-related ABC transporter, periplasmic substrate-binding protein n=2 Tax=Sulfurospirillum multivorans TaxID=66821 RepID=A0AA86ANW6_SULMK|nr:putative urea ABC transporter substrate-binding protein [Sulfurospirillum multivorans]AHJ14191.1 urea carboxylase-related ABC transporter, periplasmic substrate-binding protein [Sulfurospirillum multivorans DSM 12446]QEH07676.1 urea carboxylase-related ABC transporter, periplasmic substrate-binding protein [Sulfurospirillum multivorans]